MLSIKWINNAIKRVTFISKQSLCMYVTVQGHINEKGEKSAGFKSIKKWKNLGKNAAAYAAEPFVLQETFSKLKICGLHTIWDFNQERVIMECIRSQCNLNWVSNFFVHLILEPI